MCLVSVDFQSEVKHADVCSTVTDSASVSSFCNTLLQLRRQDGREARLAHAKARALCFVRYHLVEEHADVGIPAHPQAVHCLLHLSLLDVVANADDREVVCVVTVRELVRRGLQQNLAQHEREVWVRQQQLFAAAKVAVPLLERVLLLQ